MTASNPTDAVAALLRKWKAEDVRIGSPNSRKRIEEFEQAHQIKLANDFTEYLLKANGMEPGIPHDTDKNGYCFWPLERMRTATVELREPLMCATEVELANPELVGVLHLCGLPTMVLGVCDPNFRN